MPSNRRVIARIHTTTCKLRALEHSDLTTLLEWHNSERIQALAFHPRRVPIEESEEWFCRLQRDSRARHCVFELRCVPVGMGSILDIDVTHGTAEWGFYLGIPGLPVGTGTALTCLLLDHAYGALGLRKITGSVLSNNSTSVGLHLKLGFAFEGIRRRHILKNGVFQDVVCFSLFADEWYSGIRSVIRGSLFEGCETADGVMLRERVSRAEDSLPNLTL